ncbi:MAG: polysaccharide deacetylase family protein [Polyangiaceae bacterium]
MLKNALAEVLVRSKALSAFRRGASAVDGLLKRTAALPKMERGGLIFMFHGVAEEPSPYRLAVSRAFFEGFCATVAEGYDVLPLAELEERRRAGTLPARAVAITFDDGWADNHDIAWPVLRAHGLPATVFVTTGTIGGEKQLWFHRLAHIFEKANPEELPVCVGPWTFTLDTDGEREATVGRIGADLKKMPAAQREEMLAALGEAFGVTDFSPLAREMLTWDQLRAMDAGGFAVEAHTVTHPILGAESIEDAAREIAESREVLSGKLGRAVDLFAYPNGKDEDMTPDVIAAVERAGYKAAFTAEFGAASAANDPYKVPRVTAYAGTAAALALQIERFFYLT